MYKNARKTNDSYVEYLYLQEVMTYRQEMLNRQNKGDSTMQDVFVKIILIITIIAAGYSFLHQKDTKIETLTKQAAVDNVVIAAANDTIAKDRSSDKITENTNVVVTKKITTITTKQDNIRDKAIVKISKIEKDPAIATSKDKDDASSAVMINALWESYCTGDPSSPECKSAV